MTSIFTTIGCLLAAIAVGTGAFGAHGLEDVLSDARMETWQTAVRFQMYHALGLIAVAQFTGGTPTVQTGAWIMLAGTVIFSGSLYTLCLTDTGALGAVAPIGGTALIIAWIVIAWGALGVS